MEHEMKTGSVQGNWGLIGLTCWLTERNEGIRKRKLSHC